MLASTAVGVNDTRAVSLGNGSVFENPDSQDLNCASGQKASLGSKVQGPLVSKPCAFR
jgi:hypothetical protein